MHLLKITLEEFERFAITGTRYFTWMPLSCYQVIMGTNGCGKSSLLEQCSPLPADASDFSKNGKGKKTVYYEHEGHQYILTSSFAKGSEHSFLRDNVELNKGGTASVQRQLVAQYFNGYDESLHEILTGKAQFTRMTVAERRKWMTRLSQEDYTYALAVHDKLKTAARDAQGYVKHLTQRLHDETLALQDGQPAEELEAQVKALQEELTQLLYARFPVDHPVDIWQRNLERHISLLNEAASAVVRAGKPLNLILPERSATAIDRWVGALAGERQGLEKALERYKVEYADTEAVLNALRTAQVDDLKELEEQIRLEEQQADALSKQLERHPQLLSMADPDSMLKLTDEILSDLITCFSNLPDNSLRWVSREALTQGKEQRDLAGRQIEHFDIQLRTLREKQHALMHADRVTCPQCKHAWVPGLDPKALPEINAEIERLQTLRLEAEKRQAEASAYLEDADGYMVRYREYRGFVHAYPSLSLLWDYIQANNFDTDHPSERHQEFVYWHQELETACHVRKLRQRVQERQALLRTTPTGEQQHLNKRLKELENHIHEVTVAKLAIEAKEKKAKEQAESYRTYELARLEYEQAFKALESVYDEALGALATETMDRNITRIQGQLGAIQHALQIKQQRMALVNTLSRDLATAQLDQETLSTLVKELSPKEGEIAERMHAFMNGWVNTLNGTIRPIWSYGLEVLPCNFESGDLNYRFPVFLGGNDQRSDDIKETSTSIEQIINFAFRQTVVRYLRLKNMPLFVDELGANFDPAHRVTLYPYLVRLMDSEFYGQMFMISHYQDVSTVFQDAECLVLDSRNIAVPSVYNQHAVFG